MLIWGKDTHALPAFSGDDPLYIADATIPAPASLDFRCNCLDHYSPAGFFSITAFVGKAHARLFL